MRQSLQAADAPRNTFPQHHPIFDIGEQALGPCGELDHVIRFVCEPETERVDCDSVGGGALGRINKFQG